MTPKMHLFQNCVVLYRRGFFPPSAAGALAIARAQLVRNAREGDLLSPMVVTLVAPVIDVLHRRERFRSMRRMHAAWQAYHDLLSALLARPARSW